MMGKADSKKITRSGTRTSSQALSRTQTEEPTKDENRINRIALNDNMSLTFGQGSKKLLAFKVRF